VTLKEDYARRYGAALVPAAVKLTAMLSEYLQNLPRIDRIAARAKSIDRFVQKAEKTFDNGLPKYSDPFGQIQDQIGARIVTFYLADVDAVANYVQKYFAPIEIKALVPETESEFGYFGKHFILFLPSDIVEVSAEPDLLPQFFELQVKTLFQHAWAEANHDFAYKPAGELSPDQKRRVAFTAAQSWGADMIFEELHQQGPRSSTLP